MRVKKMIYGLGLMLGCLVFMGGAKSEAAESYITEVTLESGADAAEKLFDEGYTVMYPSIGGNTWLGYRTSSSARDAISDIYIGNSASREVDGNTISYTSAGSGISGGSLYYTKDTGAGSPLMALHLLVSGGDSETVLPLLNNGAVTVSDEQGVPVQIQTAGSSGYLFQIKKDIWRPYIGNVQVAEGNSKKEVMSRLKQAGCDYFLAENFADSGLTMVGYARTDAENEAITDLVCLSAPDLEIEGYELVSDIQVSGGYLYASREESVGNPIVDMEEMSGAEDTEVSADQWAALTMYRTESQISVPYIKDDYDYQNMLESGGEYIVMPITSYEKNDAGIVITTSLDGLSEKKALKSELLQDIDSASGEAADLEENEEKSEEVLPEDAPTAGEVKTDTLTAEPTTPPDETGTEGTSADAGASSDTSAGSADTVAETTSDASGSSENTEAADTSVVGTVTSESGIDMGNTHTIVLLGIIVFIPVVTFGTRFFITRKKSKKE